ncbi:TetR family transcriptional regulator [Cobetia amphilecti]|uniref:TetR/AcrR family transcriptional regulator n=1 Tax=Cobetia amphilecti TaxID=1055104 RepID=UPI00050146A8|nr:TetR/AcrR family transcriptional regulator [Cobetia amphilecti]KGA01172.1 TetR family transcriptional regulator [Cobetia amphilecti]
MAGGRKREFDEHIALQRAMEVFWRKGYTAASLSDLTQQMGINKTSMYSAFGNKAALFVKAARHYVETEMRAHFAHLQAPGASLGKRLRDYMCSVVRMQAATSQPRGCFLVLCQSEVAAGDLPEEAQALLESEDHMAREMFATLFATDPEAIALGLNAAADTNALTVYTVLKGTAAMARSGVPADELEAVIETTLHGIGLMTLH